MAGKVLMIFVDGVGLGGTDPTVNPLALPRAGLEALSGGLAWVDSTRFSTPTACFKGIDACLGMEGLPQSGTGQASLYTGVNCARLAGRHYGPYPHSATRDTIRTQSLFARLGPERAAFANAYPPRFFEWVNRTGRWPVTTRACLDAGVRIRTLQDLDAGDAVAADITGQGLKEDLQLAVRPIPAREAADRLIHIACNHAFTLFEVFHTDKAGHARSFEKAEHILNSLDALIGALAPGLPSDLTLVVSSDHGNIEDLSVRTHTRNPVPLAVVGPAAPLFMEARDLTDVAPAILRAAGYSGSRP